MSLPAFKRIYPKDYVSQQLEGNVATALGPVLAALILSYVTVDATLVTTTPQAITHKLGRVPQGWFLTDITGGFAHVQRITWSDTTITLEADANCDVTLWVF